MENNKLIAEFMGWTPCDTNDESKFIEPSGMMDVWSADEMLFHTSWDWLMPVIEKIEEITYDKERRFEFDFGDTQCKIYDRNGVFEVIYVDVGSKLLSTYQAVVEFIKVYNDESYFLCGSCGERCDEYTYSEDRDVDECNDCKT